MIRHILLATDGSFAADRAADFAASLAVRYRARVTVLHAFSTNVEPAGLPGSAWTHAAAQSAVAGTARHLSTLGVAEVETTVVEGPAPNVILGAIETLQADLVVVGARGASTWQGQTLGSVSHAIVERAACPVLVVK